MSDVKLLRTSRWGRVDLIFSEDDGGWYGLRWNDGRTTATYPKLEALISALVEKSDPWEEDPR